MAERNADRGEPLLFDLPLGPVDEKPGAGEAPGPEPRRESEPKRGAARAPRPAAPGRSAEPAPPDPGDAGELPLFTAEPPAAAGAGPHPASAVAAAPSGPIPAPFGARLLAALADLGVHALAAAVVWGGVALAGARLGVADLPALGVFLLAFSFLYSVVSLAFWGKTPGMAAAGVVARGDGGQPLTFGQTGLRWLAALLTAALLGLPLLVAATGRSLPDRLSGSRTLRQR